jgi:hypothetical protein
MYMLMAKLKHTKNNEAVLDIIRDFYEGDLITNEILKERVQKLNNLIDLDELDIYNELFSMLKEDSTYKNLQ